MNASISSTPLARAAADISRHCALLSASGFSHRMSLPASAAAIVQRWCIPFGSGM